MPSATATPLDVQSSDLGGLEWLRPELTRAARRLASEIKEARTNHYKDQINPARRKRIRLSQSTKDELARMARMSHASERKLRKQLARIVEEALGEHYEVTLTARTARFKRV